VSDPRINDGCYFGGGSASGEEVCVPLKATTTDGRIAEAEALAVTEANDRALRALKSVRSQTVGTTNGESVKVGQIVMFIKLDERQLSDEGVDVIEKLLAVATTTGQVEKETVWQRLVSLANNFVDGVLKVFTLKADRVEVKEEICVDGVCLDAEKIRQLLEVQNNQGSSLPEEPPLTPVVENEEGEEEVGDETVTENAGEESEVGSEEESEEIVGEETGEADEGGESEVKVEIENENTEEVEGTDLEGEVVIEENVAEEGEVVTEEIMEEESNETGNTN
jgi:hypothetical protein